MISIEEFDAIYENDLRERLQDLDSLRKKVRNRLLRTILCFVLTVASIVAVGLLAERVANEALPFVFFFSAFGFLILGIVFAVMAAKSHKEYRRRYKEEVVKRIVQAICPDWSYEAESGISEAEYAASGIFPERYDRFKSDDLVYGAIEKTDFRCSEVHSEKKEVTRDKDGKRQERWVTIFHGLFFHADFNKHFKGRTFVEPDYTERFFGGLAATFQRMSPKGQLVKLENIEFEKLFVVYGSDQIEPRYILSPAMMESIVGLAKAFKHPIRLSFVGNRVFFTIDFRHALFEPRVFKSCVNQEEARKMFRLFKVNELIISELNLNTRIWTKD